MTHGSHPNYSSYLTAENICIYGGITGADELACITEKDVKENYQMDRWSDDSNSTSIYSI